MNDKVNLQEKLASFDERWVPKLVGELNGQHVKLAKLYGDYVWHRHAEEDELFLVVTGLLEIHLRERVVELGPGELFIVPRGVEHMPRARGLVEVLLFEPATTRNTGQVENDYTIEAADLEWI